VIGILAVAACSYTPPAPITPTDGAVDADLPPTDTPPDTTAPSRVGAPVAEWHFDETGGMTIADSVPGAPLALTLNAAAVVNQGGGGLTFNARSSAISGVTPHVNSDAKASSAVTLEAWVTAANATQGASSYSLIAAISVSSMLRNIGLEQRAGFWVGRVRTSTTSTNGDPTIISSAPVDPTKPTHLVLVADGTSRILYVDGVPAQSAPSGGGAFTGWDPNYRIRIGDEDGANRAWLGTIWFLAFHDRALTANEVMTNFLAGHDCDSC